jgi:GGDEF domain-containing protein
VVEAGIAVCRETLLNISVGAAFCPENGTDAEGLLAEADRRRYLGKQSHKHPAVEASQDLAALAASLSPPVSADSPA